MKRRDLKKYINMNKIYKIFMFLCCLMFLSINSPSYNIITPKKLQKLQPKLSHTVASEYLHLINKYCTNIDTELVVAIYFVESSILFYRINNKQDIGLGQIRLSTWGDIYKVNKYDLLNPITNIEISCKILKQLKKSHPDNLEYWAYYHNSNSLLRQRYIKKINHIIDKLKEIR
jgi:soluble lytic murein transglycosylase-like protein